QWDRQHGAGLLLAHMHHIAANVLTSHAHDIGATLRRVEQERDRQPRLVGWCASKAVISPSVQVWKPSERVFRRSMPIQGSSLRHPSATANPTNIFIRRSQ